MGTLEGKVAIIAGGATNQGAESAKLMSRQGAKIVVGDLNIKDAEATAAEIRKAGGDAVAFKFDITKEEEVRALVDFAVKTYGGVDVLHNNVAAIGAIDSVIGRDYSTDVLKLNMADYDRTMAVNLRGFILTMRYAVPEMIKRGGGSIINISSIASVGAGSRGHAYAISKAGVNAATRAVAAAYGQYNIRCNAILPGGIARTGNVDQTRAAVISDPKGKPIDIANMVVFLASDETARYVNGALIQIDGGPASGARG
jgi:NAD(P)-dependent dehydrogenase (short-subunit alcohol dehydrogenase family)